ncbi:zinc finger CCCH-type antiviral protein 1-like [Polyodon spathula]|uniref:zinc finger CCCH-type antiviral protein 1-like n=1 Tax=Polyodon spathula TaxID=7913 RepID=UPI001B7ECEE0|nr:zinc finger CCCH-type antiviral protein 1-like [Polyodon spathula]
MASNIVAESDDEQKSSMYEYRDREDSSHSLSDTGDDLSDSESDSDEEQGAVASSGASAVKQEPCRYYNSSKCKYGKKCKYLHVCKYHFNGKCKMGSNCPRRHSAASQSDSSSDEDDRGERTATPTETHDKPYKWQLNSGENWRDIENDYVIEAQYSLPGARGIKIYNTIYGAIDINFNKMRIRKKKIRVQRKSFDDCGQETEWLWYYHGNSGWIEYGQKDSKGSATSLKSSDIEKEYQKKPNNCLRFTAGQTHYEINFKEMRQINLASNHKRRVVRRPKITALQVKTGKTSLTSSSQQQHQVSPGGTKTIWQFEGDSGKWYEFKYRSATDTESSVSSKEIEAKYQANPEGSMTFKAGKYQYKLNFSDMTQTNLASKKIHRIQRTVV